MVFRKLGLTQKVVTTFVPHMTLQKSYVPLCYGKLT